MKNSAREPSCLSQQRQPHPEKPPPRARPGRPEGVKAGQRRAQQKRGAYKRLELFLGLDAAIALRRLMRDGRSAREVIEALLLEEGGRRHGQASPDAGAAP